MPYIPHTEEDIQEMLSCIGVSKIEELFNEIPKELFSKELVNIPSGINEMSMLKHALGLASQNEEGICFIGAGSYEHHIPAAVWDIASRGEFLTAYTPYQAEASQGTLQLLYEFQTMIAELTGLEVANSSLYDGATALAEAVLMAVRINKRSTTKKILVPQTLHPFYRDTIKTIVSNQEIEFLELPFAESSGTIAYEDLANYSKQDITAIIIPQPNFFGCLEATDLLCDWASSNHVISIACVNPISLGLLSAPGTWGAKGVDIACGEGQPLGCPIASGGPYFGFLSTRMEYVRQMPGRLIGRTVDGSQKSGYTLTLQAREQHIRRGKATSNICTNQGLLITAATIYMSLLGAEGLRRTALQCHHNTTLLVNNLCDMPHVKQVFAAPYFHEAVLQFLPHVNIKELLLNLQKVGINGGYGLEVHHPLIKNTLLVCATEMRTEEEINYYVKMLKDILKL